MSTMLDRVTAEIRNYRGSDFDEYLALLAEAENSDPTGRCVVPGCVAEQLTRPNYSPEQDLLIARNGDIVGYLDVRPELTIERVVLDCWVRPQHRRQGLASDLLAQAIARAGRAGARVAHVDIREDNVVANSVLSRLGFNSVRQFLELRFDLARLDETANGALPSRSDTGVDRAGLVWRHLQPGEEDSLTELQNRAFAGSWGYSPNTVEEIAFRTGSGSCSREDVIMACEEDRAVGYCWTVTSCEHGVPSARKGRILMVGVDPDCRSRGIGRALVLAGLGHLRGKGLQVAELTVDCQNRSACALYQSLGFEVEAGTLCYEKTLDSGRTGNSD